MKKLLTTASLSLLSVLTRAGDPVKNDTGPGDDHSIIYIILGVLVVAAVIYYFSTRKKKS